MPAYVLRYWESEFNLLRPKKNPAGQRLYRPRDLELILRIKTLLYDERLTLEGAKKRLVAESRGDPDPPDAGLRSVCDFRLSQCCHAFVAFSRGALPC